MTIREGVIKWLGSRLKGISKIVPANQDDAKAETEYKDELDKNLNDLNVHHLVSDQDDQSLTDITSAFNKNIKGIGNAFWKQGKSDGSVGLKNQRIVDVQSSFWASHQADHMRAAIEGATLSHKEDMKAEKELFEDVKINYNHRNNHWNWVEKEYHHNPREFSVLLGIIYLLIAFFLVLADIPLALELTDKGFEIEGAVDALVETPIPNADNQMVEVSDTDFRYLLRRFMRVFKNNWEVFLLSIGIALCTIYIKIFYDELIGRPLDKPIMYRRQLKNEFDASDEEMKEIQKNQNIRRWFKIGVLVFTILTIIMLGLFRYININIEENNLSDIMTFEGVVTLITFICITLLFPIIGGICASLGLNCVHNARELKKSKNNLDDAKKYYQNSKESYKTATTNFYNWERFLLKLFSPHEKKAWVEWSNSTTSDNSHVDYLLDDTIEKTSAIPPFEVEISTYLKACYQSGFNYGVLFPNKAIVEIDLFDKVRSVRNQFVSRDFSNKIIQSDGTA